MLREVGKVLDGLCISVGLSFTGDMSACAGESGGLLICLGLRHGKMEVGIFQVVRMSLCVVEADNA